MSQSICYTVNVYVTRQIDPESTADGYRTRSELRDLERDIIRALSSRNHGIVGQIDCEVMDTEVTEATR